MSKHEESSWQKEEQGKCIQRRCTRECREPVGAENVPFVILKDFVSYCGSYEVGWQGLGFL